MTLITCTEQWTFTCKDEYLLGRDREIAKPQRHGRTQGI